jgi:hypothetical protein
MQEISPDINHAEGDEHKGAVESDRPEESPGDDAQNESMAGQLGHRDQDEEIKENDTDFPEPNAEAEHSGESQN